MFQLGDIVETPRGEGIVFALVGAPEGGNGYVVLLKERDEVSGAPASHQYPAADLTAGRAHPTYVVGQTVSYKGRGATITAIADDLTITLAIDNPAEGDNPIAHNNRAVMPHWRLTMLEEFQ
jgi:hypothetical protein